MTILILHGIGGHAGIHWQQWLHDELAVQGHSVSMPDLPDSDHPDRRTWLKTVMNTADHIKNGELVIVGHSLGVATALDYIELQNAPVRGFVSVSGFAYDYGADINSYFMREKNVDFKRVRHDLQRAAVFFGDNDPYVTQEALHALAGELR